MARQRGGRTCREVKRQREPNFFIPNEAGEQRRQMGPSAACCTITPRSHIQGRKIDYQTLTHSRLII